MSNCGKCRGSGLWQGRSGYKCFACGGSGQTIGRLERIARADAKLNGRMLQVDALPTLAEVKAGRAAVAAAAVSVRLVGGMGPGAARLRAAALVRSGTVVPGTALVPAAGTALRPITPGVPRLYAELFPDSATDAERAEVDRMLAHATTCVGCGTPASTTGARFCAACRVGGNSTGG